ncbi:hypothetical protein HT136_08520 [Novosphingobium profundi]|uniref:hypothetical protein n=1 Tax=Novosphingobium profundi TaxID=1774954 RepID=UPI001BD95017|nr:hypothetical protein [Novosphingobium profundi]MBT0668412.1 hypothetical protein [Novosphingobium profundi]
MKTKRIVESESYFSQWINGEYQYDPIAGCRNGFATVTVDFNSEEHKRISQYIRDTKIPGMITEYRVENRYFREREFTKEPVKYEFEHRAYLMSALLSGGAA